MRKYPEYKDSGVEWIGEIPTQWQLKRLKYCDSVIMGQSPSSDDYNYEGKGLPFLQGNADFSSKFPTPRIWCETANKIAIKDDVLLSVRAPIGEVNLADQKFGIGRGLCAIRSVITNCTLLYYIALSLNKELNSLGTGSTYTAVSTDEVKNVYIPQPDILEQASIVTFLDKKTSQIDSLIEKKKRLIELLKEYRTAIINHAVTKGLDPNVKMKDSGIEWIGEIPEHWEVKRLKFVTQSISTGSTPPTSEPKYYREGALNWFSPSDFKEHVMLETSKRKINGHSIDEKKVTLYDKNTVLLVGIGATLGKVGIIDKPSTCNQQINAISFNIVFNPYFGLYYLHANRDALISFSNFSTLPILNQTQTKDIYITCPPRTEQDQIVQYLRKQYDKTEELILRTGFEIDYLNEYRTSLISDAVTGKIDVRNYAEQESEQAKKWVQD